MPSLMTTTEYNGGIRISKAAKSIYDQEAVGDILVYASASNQKVLVGPSNETGLAALALASNVVNVTTHLQIEGTTTMNEIHLGFSGPVHASERSWFSFSNAATFAEPALFAGSNNVFAGPASFWDSRLTIGSNANLQYPIMIQTVGDNNISLYTVGDQAAFSDARFKTDVRAIEGAVAKVAAIGGYTFAWLGRDPAERSAGVLAQEVRAVLPEVVGTDADGKLHVSYGNLSALLIQAVKEVAGRQLLLAVTTAAADEDFRVALPPPPAPGSPWRAAFVSGGAAAAYARSFAAVSAAGDAVVGRAELPGTYQLLVVA
jgi:hypothetical protein